MSRHDKPDGISDRLLTVVVQCVGNLQRMWRFTLLAKASICLCEPAKLDFLYRTLAYSKHCVYWQGGARRPKMSGFFWLLVISENTHRVLAAFPWYTYPLPAVFCGLRLWNSISSTVHTAPFTFSKRTKHLWRLRLCLTAFWKITEKNAGIFNVKSTECFRTLFLFRILISTRNMQKRSYLPSSCIAPEICKVSCEPVVDFI